MYAVIKARVQIHLKFFAKNLDPCFYYSMHAVENSTACNPNPCVWPSTAFQQTCFLKKKKIEFKNDNNKVKFFNNFYSISIKTYARSPNS
jgi:hypothetical protein